LTSINDFWFNHADLSFRNLFAPYSEDSKVPLQQRIDTLEDLIKVYREHLDKFVPALESCLFLGSEYFDYDYEARQKNIYVPKDEELKYYQSKSLGLLLAITTSVSKTAIVNHFREHVRRGLVEEFFYAIETIINEEGKIDLKLRRELIYINEKPSIYSEHIRKRVDSLIKKHDDGSLRNKLEAIVAFAPHTGTEWDDKGKKINKSDTNARELARELANSNAWLEHVDILLKGEQSMTFAFGQELGLLRPLDNKIIKTVIKTLLSIPVAQRDPQNVFIYGYLVTNVNDDFVRSVIAEYLQHESLAVHAVWMTRAIKEKRLSDFEALYGVVKAYPNLLRNGFNFVSMNDLKSNDATSLFAFIRSITPEGPNAAVSMCFDYVEKMEFSEELKSIIKETLFVKGIFSIRSNYPNFYYKYTRLLSQLMENEAFTQEEAVFVCDEIIDSSGLFNPISEYELNKIIKILFESHWEVSWAKLAIAMQEGKLEMNFGMRSLFSMQHLPDDKLIAWMEKYPSVSPQVIIGIVEFKTLNDKKWEWTTIAQYMLRKFPDNSRMLSRLRADIFNTSDRNIRPRFSVEIQLLEEIKSWGIPQLTEFANSAIHNFKLHIKDEERHNENYELGSY
jgi:hypothetical protein